MQNPQDVQLAAKALAGRLPKSFLRDLPRTLGLVLGTGLSGLTDSLDMETGCKIPFQELPRFPASGVQSHAGMFLCGRLGGAPVLIQAGRVHLYEGRSPAEVCMGARVMGCLGLKKLVLTNAAGSLNPLFPAGGLMRLTDMINHTGASPLAGVNHEAWGPRFPDFSRVFDQEMAEIADKTALELGIRLDRGIYIGVHGPELETPAESRMYRSWGADAIGMSTVLEATAARHMGMKILGISCLTNQNLPDAMAETSIEAILVAAARCGESLTPLLRSIAPLLEKL